MSHPTLIRVVIQHHFDDLVANLRDSLSLSVVLFAKGRISEIELDRIKAERTPQGKATELLQILLTKDDSALRPLYNFVKKSNPWLGNRILCSIEGHKEKNIKTYPTPDIIFNKIHYADILSDVDVDKIQVFGTFKRTTCASNILLRIGAITLAIVLVIFGGLYYFAGPAKPGEIQDNSAARVRETEDLHLANPPIPTRSPPRNASYFNDYNGKDVTTPKSDEITNVSNSDFTTKHAMPTIPITKLELINQDSHITSDFASLSLYGPTDWEAAESIKIIIPDPQDTFSDITSYLSNKTKLLSLEGNLSRSQLMEFFDSNVSYSLQEINFSGPDICAEFYTPDQPCLKIYTLDDLSVMTFRGIRNECSDLFQYLRKCVNYGHPFNINVSDSLLIFAGRSEELSKLETLSGNPMHYTESVVGNAIEIGAQFHS